jgi:hypothetical protein
MRGCENKSQCSKGRTLYSDLTPRTPFYHCCGRTYKFKRVKHVASHISEAETCKDPLVQNVARCHSADAAHCFPPPPLCFLDFLSNIYKESLPAVAAARVLTHPGKPFCGDPATQAKYVHAIPVIRKSLRTKFTKLANRNLDY